MILLPFTILFLCCCLSTFSSVSRNINFNSLSDKATKFLTEARGNIDLAHQLYFRSEFNNDDSHNDIVRKTWDVMAEYLPMTDTAPLPDRTKKRLSTIAQACKGGAQLLDVGCGPATLVPFLRKSGMKLSGYVGLDISPEMVRISKVKVPNARFYCEDFEVFASAAEFRQERFQMVLLNGVIHYSKDPSATIVKALKIAGESVVVAHYQGARFVKQEKLSMPSIIQEMPDLKAVSEIAKAEGFAVDSVVSRKQNELEDLYLIKLQRG